MPPPSEATQAPDVYKPATPSPVVPTPAIAAAPPPLADVGDGGQLFRDCEECPVMVVIPSGSGLIGSPVGESGHELSEEPRQRVNLARPIAVGRDSITYAEWHNCLAEGGCGNFPPPDMGWGGGAQPVVLVSWNDAKSYVAWLSKKTHETYRLLSESEWEYGARACRTSVCRDWAFWFGNAINPDLANYDWRYSYAGGRKAQALGKPRPINSYGPNRFGLFNMAGNVQQWVEDCWNPNLIDLPSDGAARVSGDCSSRVVRGGSWDDEPVNVRSAARKYDVAKARLSYIGFRVARELSR